MRAVNLVKGLKGLLSPTHINEARKADPRDPGSSALRLAPRGFSVGVVVSLGGGFVWKIAISIHAPISNSTVLLL